MAAVADRDVAGRGLGGGLGTDAMPDMEQRISLVTLGVRDLARARQFHEAFGLDHDGRA